jgi:hypothetical protein
MNPHQFTEDADTKELFTRTNRLEINQAGMTGSIKTGVTIATLVFSGVQALVLFYVSSVNAEIKELAKIAASHDKTLAVIEQRVDEITGRRTITETTNLRLKALENKADK